MKLLGIDSQSFNNATCAALVKTGIFAVLVFNVSFSRAAITDNPASFSQEPRKPPAAYDVAVATITEIEDFTENESTTTYEPGAAKVSEGLRKKILELESIAAQEKGQNDPALERLAGKLWFKTTLIRFNDEFVEVLADKKVDWRVRYLMVKGKGQFVSDRKIEKYLPALKKILLDKDEHPRVRGIIAMVIGKLAETNEDAKAVLTSVAADSANPPEVVQPAMSVLGRAGIDDVDRLIEIMNREPKSMNDMGVNLNAVRALCGSKNPKAPDLLVKIFDESVPDSFFNATAIEELGCMVMTSPERRAKLEPVLVPKLLKLLDNRSRMGASRHRAAMLLIHMKAKGVYEPITRWFRPVKGIIAEVGGGGGETDVGFGAQFLADLCDKRGIKVLEEVLRKYPTDPRFSWSKEKYRERGVKYPEDVPDYKQIKEDLERLRKCKIK